MNRTLALSFALMAGVAAWLHAGCAPTPARDPGPAVANPVIRRGDLEDRFLLTGEVRAAAARRLAVPRTPDWQATIQWLRADGTRVRAGETVAQLDNSSIVAKLEDQKLALAEAEMKLEKARADAGADRARKSLERLRCRVERDQARLDAGVPESTLSRREYQEKQLALEKAEAALEKAEREMDSFEKSSAIQIRLATIARDLARRKLDRAESALGELTLKSPTDGILIVAMDYHYGRKWQEGDSVQAGQVLAEIPDLSRLEVEAYLSDVDDGQIAPGLPARCRLDAYPDRVFRGSIAWVGAVASGRAASSNRRFFRVRVALEKSDPAVLRPGMSVKVEVIRRRWAKALLAPLSSLDLRGSAPLLLLAGGRTRRVTLTGCGAVECALAGGPPEGTPLGSLP